jgi:hypothetical protein
MKAKRYVKERLRAIKPWLDDGEERPSSPEMPTIPFDNNYQWMWAAMRKTKQHPECVKRPQYIWGVLQGAALGKALGMPRMSVMEFCVAGGAGLLAMQRTAELCEEMINIGIDVYGFDTGTDLPKPRDYRDVPWKWSEGYYLSDQDQIAKRLRRASLKLGLIKETVPAFIQAHPSPVAFVAVDHCLYRSAKDALSFFTQSPGFCCPELHVFSVALRAKISQIMQENAWQFLNPTPHMS